MVAPRIALATAGAVGLYVCPLGSPMPIGCVAGAVPSPTHGSDLRECLRLSAIAARGQGRSSKRWALRRTGLMVTQRVGGPPSNAQPLRPWKREPMQTTPFRAPTDPLPEVTALRLVSGCSPNRQPHGTPPMTETGRAIQGGTAQMVMLLRRKLLLAAAAGATAWQIAACATGSHQSGQPTPARPGPTAPMSTSTSAAGGEATLPEHFEIQYGDLVSDCHVNANSVTCNETLKNLKPTESYTATMTGKLSGMTVTGYARSYATNPDPQSPECTGTAEMSGPISYIFRPNGTLSARWGPYQRIFTNSCLTSQPPPNSGEDPNREPISEWTATWSPIK